VLLEIVLLLSDAERVCSCGEKEKEEEEEE
jgi:hypothetical protein